MTPYSSRASRQGWKRDFSHPKESNLRREFRQVVDAEFLLDFGHLIDDFEEAVIAEEFVFLLFEFLAKRVEFVGRDDAAEGGEEDGVLAGFMGAIHADELPHGISQPATVIRVSQALHRRKSKRDVRQL